MTDERLALARRRAVSRNLRMSVRGVAFSVLVAGIVTSGLIPMSATVASVLLGLAGALAVTRILRGLWAVRVARHLFGGWSRRRMAWRQPLQVAGPVAGQVALPAPKPESADRRAVKALTSADDEPLVARARARGLSLVARLDELKALLADTDLSGVLRRPVAEELARTETDLEALLLALSELSRAEEAQRDDLLQRLAARLEIEGAVPAGLLAPA
jgi:hypothetical protein